MRRSILQLLALAGTTFACVFPTATSVAAPLEPLGQHGRWITDASGRVAIFHGVNIVTFATPTREAPSPQGQGVDADDIAFLAQHGFNTVRLGVYWHQLEPTPGAFDVDYLDPHVEFQQDLADAGIFSTITFHQYLYGNKYGGAGLPDWSAIDDGLLNEPKGQFPGTYFTNAAENRAWDNFFANATGPEGVGVRDRLAETWRRVAARFEGLPGVLGYDLLNEPWPGSAYPTCASPPGCPPGGFDEGPLTDFSRSVTDSIRDADDRHIVWYEPNLLFDVGADTSHGDVEDSRVGMAYHNYCLGEAPGLPAAPDPLMTCRDVGERRVFENAERHSDTTGAALLMGEFVDTANTEVHRRMTDLADEFMTSWQYFAYWDSSVPLIRDPNEPPEGDNIRAEALEEIVRPYPQVVAGTPTSYGYERETGRFELAWETTLPDGRAANVGRGRETEVFVPDLQYATTGWHVNVRGAEVVRAGSQRLSLRNCAGAEEAAVAVSPGAGPPTRSCAEQAAARSDFPGDESGVREGANGGAGGVGGTGGQGGGGERCFGAASSVRGNRVGRAGLARSRATVRGTFGSDGRYRRFVDRYCLLDGGTVRIAYATPRELRRLSSSERERIGRESILVLTTSRSLRIRGVRRGMSVRALHRRIGRNARVRVGKNLWYFRKGRNSRHIFKVQGGRVREMGIADARLTKGRTRAKRFFRQGR